MDYSIWAFLLLAVGVTLLIAEVFIPSGGVIVVLAVLSLVGALAFAWNAWWSSNPMYFWAFVSGMVVMLPVVIGGAFYVWPNTPIGRRAILDGPAPHEVASFVEQEEKHGQMVGKVGETLTMLNPAGIVRIDGHRVHCQSEGLVIESGVRVRVLSARFNRVIVRREPIEAELSPPDVNAQNRQESPDQTLDFDLS